MEEGEWMPAKTVTMWNVENDHRLCDLRTFLEDCSATSPACMHPMKYSANVQRLNIKLDQVLGLFLSSSEPHMEYEDSETE